jgi:hypothetical protein
MESLIDECLDAILEGSMTTDTEQTIETIELITLHTIRDDHIIQLRESLDHQAIDEYAEVYRKTRKSGKRVIPPITVFRSKDGVDYVPDGGHRIAAARKAGLKKIEAAVRDGERRDALMFACGANARHGIRRTRADKRNAVRTILEDPKWAKQSDRWIATKCCVSADLVGDERRKLAQLSKSTVDAPRVGADGKVRRMPQKLPAPEPSESIEEAPIEDDSKTRDEQAPSVQAGARGRVDPIEVDDQVDETDDSPVEACPPKPIRSSSGVGVRHACEAIDALKHIPPGDALCDRGFEIVRDWIERNGNLPRTHKPRKPDLLFLVAEIREAIAAEKERIESVDREDDASLAAVAEVMRTANSLSVELKGLGSLIEECLDATNVDNVQ